MGIQSVVRPSAVPFLFHPAPESARKNRAVLLIHGFTSNPQEMRFLGEMLRDAGFVVSAPRLPGHGTDGEDFLRSGWRDWLGACRNAHAELRASYGEPYVCGISMGALLSILLASENSPERIALVAPAVVVTQKIIVLSPLIGLFMPRYRIRQPRPKETEEEAWFEREYWSWRYPRQAASVWKLQRMARAALRRVRAETLTVITEKDATVPPRAAGLIERRIEAPRTSRLTLHESTHRILTDVEKETACRRIVEWFSAEADAARGLG